MRNPNCTTKKNCKEDVLWQKPVVTVCGMNIGDYKQNSIWTRSVSSRMRYIEKIVSKHIHPFVSVRFKFQTNVDSDIRISWDTERGSWSYIGQTHDVPRGEPTMNLGWLDHPSEEDGTGEGTVIVHEFCHALGVNHEHQSGHYIHWDVPVVLAEMKEKHNWTITEIYENILDPFSFGVNDKILDENSIMLYWFPQHFTLDKRNFTFNKTLSEQDKVLLRTMYPPGDEDQGNNARQYTVTIVGVTVGPLEGIILLFVLSLLVVLIVRSRTKKLLTKGVEPLTPGS